MLIALIVLIVLTTSILFMYFISIEKKKKKSIEIINTLKKNNKIDEDFINFPKYYINLDRNEDRKINLEKEIDYYGIKNIKRVKAFDGREIINFESGELDGYKYCNIKDKTSRKAELAITMSHIKAINTAYEDGYDKALILEDDIEFTLVPHWGKSITEIINLVPEDCDLLLLSTLENKREIKIIPEKNILNGVAYIITKSGMEKIINKFFNNNVFDFHNYNHIVWDISIIKDLKIYSTNKSLFLLFNFKFNSTNTNEKQKFCFKSYKILMKYC